MKAVALFLFAATVLLGLTRWPSEASENALGGAAAPAGLAPADSPVEDLGRHLFFDPRLSGDGSMSCATCHNPEKSWADGMSLSRSYPGSDGFRNTKSVLNAVRVQNFYWDGRLSGSDLETQIRDSITETHFMNMDGRLMLERLKQVPEYVQMFADAFGEGTEPSFGGTLRAIAAFERTLVTGPSAFDSGDLTEAARRGQRLFEGKAGCASCHSGPDFTDGNAHRTGAPDNEDLLGQPLRHLTYRSFIKAMGVPGYMTARTDVGRFTVSKSEEDRGRFMTPSLRQVARTAPYMHSGVFAALSDVVAFYNTGREGQPLGLTASETGDIVAFLESLTGAEPVVRVPIPPSYKPIDNWLEVRN